MLSRRLGSGIVAAAALVGMGGPVMAAQVSYVISGEVAFVVDGSGTPDLSGVAVGVPFQGSFTYDTGMVATVGSPPFSQTYEQPAPIAPLGLSVTVLGHSFSAGDGTALELTVDDDVADAFRLVSGDVAEQGALVESLTLTLEDAAGAVFSGLAIPGALSLGGFTLAEVGLLLDPGDPVTGVEMTLEIQSLSAPYVAPQIYFVDTATSKVSRSDLDGSNVVDLVVADDPIGLTVDPVGGHIYWTECCLGTVQRSNLDGSGQVQLVSGLGFPYGIGLAPSAGRMLFAELAFPPKVYSAPIGGGGFTSIHDSVGSVSGLAVDDAAGKVYWSEFTTERKIWRADVNGANAEILVSSATAEMAEVQGLALDTADGKMYWTDLVLDRIYRANLDGTSIELLADGLSAGLGNPIGIDVDVARGKIYWTDTDSDKIQRANLDGSNVEDVVTNADGLSFPRDVSVLAGTACDPPDLPVTVDAVTLPSGPAGPVSLSFSDPNGPAEVTGYNVYRSDDPSLPQGTWPLLGLNVADIDPVTPGVQWEDGSGDVSPTGTWYYTVVAYNASCPIEGPQ